MLLGAERRPHLSSYKNSIFTPKVKFQTANLLKIIHRSEKLDILIDKIEKLLIYTYIIYTHIIIIMIKYNK